MRFSTSFFVVSVLGALPIAFAGVGVHCGTTDDATLSDCKALVEPGNWRKAWAGVSNVCHYTNPLKPVFAGVAYNTACRGNCCVYAAGDNSFFPDEEQTRKEAAGLLGCGAPSVNKINGMEMFEDGHGVCLSNGNGCGDCFDDADFV